MDNQILHSTQNILKYIDANMSIICNIYQKFANNYLDNKDTGGMSLMKKFSRTVLHIEFYAKNNKWRNVNELYGETVIMYKIMKFINKNIKLNYIEQKIIKVIMVYLLCICKLFKEDKNFNHNITNNNKINIRLVAADSDTSSK